jgi:hypothetical protein
MWHRAQHMLRLLQKGHESMGEIVHCQPVSALNLPDGGVAIASTRQDIRSQKQVALQSAVHWRRSHQV